MQINIKRVGHTLGLFVILLFLGGCASSVVVKGTIPDPLVEKLPLTASLSYNEEFTNYTYVESQKNRKSVVSKFDFKDAQINMFDQIFGAILILDPADVNQTDLIIEPHVLDFQYSTPAETKTTQYEVWLKYRLQIMDGERQTLADWVIKGYGKTPTATLQSTGAAFNAAANVAMRDVGAQLAIRFGRQRSVQDLIAQKNGISTPTETLASETSVENVEQIVNQASGVIDDDVLDNPDERITAEQTDDEDSDLGAVQEDLAKDVESAVEEAQQDLQIEDVEQAPSEER